MEALRFLTALGAVITLAACANVSGLVSGSDSGTQPVPADGIRADAASPADRGSQGVDASTSVEAASADVAPPAEYTLTITSPHPDAGVTGTIDVVGMGPGFLNVEVHSQAGALLARVTPTAATGDFTAPVDTTQLGTGLEAVTIDGWDAPAGDAFMHHATVSLPLHVSGSEAVDASSPPPTEGGVTTTCASDGLPAMAVMGGASQIPTSTSLHYMGAYVKNTQTLYDFDTFSGFHSDLLVTFTSCDTYEDMATQTWGYDLMTLQPPGVNIVIETCLNTSEDTVFADVTSGMYDSYYEAAAQLVVSKGYPNGVIRLGHEFNGTQYPWYEPSTTGDPDWVAMFRHVATIYKAANPNLVIMWNPGLGPYGAPDKDYPGDDVVDVIGLDAYDSYPGAYPDMVTEQYGLSFWSDFAATHNKPLAFPEWGYMSGAGDDSSYMQGMFDFMTSHNTYLEAFWDSDDAAASQISTGELPQSGAMYQQTFGKYRTCQ